MLNRLIGAVLSLLSFSIVLAAHHSLSGSFDLDRTTQIVGVVTQVDWVNPHVVYSVDVADSSGLTSNWKVEAPPPHAMVNNGIEKTTLKVGDRITFSGYAAKLTSGAVRRLLAMTRITLPTGKTVEMDPTGWMPLVLSPTP